MKKLLWMLVGYVLIAVSQSTYATTIDKIILFGDSLSDNGNLYGISSKAHNIIPLIPIVPKAPPYFEGRFTNGQVWIEHVAAAMNVPLEDYAYGGAWIEPAWNSFHLVPLDLGAQISLYRAESLFDSHRENHLYVVWAGANDYVHGRTNMDEAVTNAINIMKDHIELLIYLGAKHFFIPTIPNLGLVPEVREQGADYMKVQEAVSRTHNAKLLALLEEEKSAHPDVNFVVMDVFADMNDVIAHADQYHLKNMEEACYAGSYMFKQRTQHINMAEVYAANTYELDILNNPSLREAYLTSKLAESGVEPCANPDEYLFWDHIHPTRVMHQVLATLAELHLHENGYVGSTSK